jgi:hypothetical protein
MTETYRPEYTTKPGCQPFYAVLADCCVQGPRTIAQMLKVKGNTSCMRMPCHWIGHGDNSSTSSSNSQSSSAAAVGKVLISRS